MGRGSSVELLAPAGNKEGLYGAIHAGADAVYLGGDRFGARAYADNFTTEELVEGIRYAHLWGRKIYLTVNTLMKEKELSALSEYLSPFYEAGLDGVIVQDIGALVYIREHFPELALHASTQMTLTGEHGAALLKEMGVCRIVPARELSLQEIVRIKERTGVAIETFVHGAMCYCYSGQCLFSSILGGRSGNRGRCAQPCRLPYRVSAERKGKRMISEEGYPLSLKDLCTIEMLPELIEGGIDSFKIEGRMKKPEYAAGVTAVYRKYIDRYYAGLKQGIDWRKKKFEIEKGDLERLSCLYIRSERQEGYYHRHNGRDMVTLQNPAYRSGDEAQLLEIRREYLEKSSRMGVRVKADFRTGERARVTLSLGEIAVSAEGERVQHADKKPVTSENIENQLKKMGDSVFSPERMEILADGEGFYSLGAINELRRRAVRGLEDALIRQNGLSPHREKAALRTEENAVEGGRFRMDGGSPCKTSRLHLSLRTQKQLEAVGRLSSGHSVFDRIYVEGDLFDIQGAASASGCDGEGSGGREKRLDLCRRLSKQSEIVLSLPYIFRQRDEGYAENLARLLQEYPDVFSGVLARSLDGLGFARDLGRRQGDFAGKIYGDAGLYVWNRETLYALGGLLSGFCLPYELNGREQLALAEGSPIPCEKIIFGRIPMMITANCVVNTTDGCEKGKGQCGASRVSLIDRYQKQFPVERNCLHCYNIIYNSVPLSLHGELSRWRGRADFRLDLTVEDALETENILRCFAGLQASGFEGKDLGSEILWPFNKGSYTTGHERRGVE